jgi:hypothetical protein
MTETDPVSETLCLLVIEFRTMDKVQKPIVNETFSSLSACQQYMRIAMHNMDTLQYEQATVRRVFISRCWAATGGPMDCLGGYDVIRDLTIEKVFSVGPCFASCCATHAKYFPP